MPNFSDMMLIDLSSRQINATLNELESRRKETRQHCAVEGEQSPAGVKLLKSDEEA